jgi:monofunctional biosynthetic peptidoglycan transglycosylase
MGFIKRVAVGSLVVLVVFLLATALKVLSALPEVAELKDRNPASSALMEQRRREAAQKNRTFRVHHRWVAYGAIPQLLKDAVRVSEDGSFFQHRGVDFNELWVAVKQSWQEDKALRGASTITQQLAKNLYLSTERSFLRKLREFVIAKKLEAALSKDRIFHLYLNVIEFGPGVFGVEAAARQYFGKSVGELNLEEIVRLTAVIPRPLIENPTVDSRWLKWRATWIAAALMRYGYIENRQHAYLIDRFR